MKRKSITNEKIKFENYLNHHGHKLTHSRQSVFHEVMQAHGHFAPEELVKQCKRHNRKVSRASVYRNLHELLEAGIIRKTAFGEKHQHFEHLYDEKPHHHALCIRCYTMIEFPDLNEDDRYHPFLKKKKFHILGHELHFYGICQNCQTKEDRPHAR